MTPDARPVGALGAGRGSGAADAGAEGAEERGVKPPASLGGAGAVLIGPGIAKPPARGPPIIEGFSIGGAAVLGASAGSPEVLEEGGGPPVAGGGAVHGPAAGKGRACK